MPCAATPLLRLLALGLGPTPRELLDLLAALQAIGLTTTKGPKISRLFMDAIIWDRACFSPGALVQKRSERVKERGRGREGERARGRERARERERERKREKQRERERTVGGARAQGVVGKTPTP